MAAEWRRNGLAAVVILLGAMAQTAMASTPIMPLDEVRAGMHGVGRTVFQGTTIEPFNCTVIGVLEGFDFEMDMILIKIEDSPVVTRKWGVIAGMSGSPIYIDGKMIGALAYGWEFQNEPIAGVTPIEQMLAQYDPNHPEARAAAVRRAEREKRRDEQLKAADRDLQMAGALRPVDGPLKLNGQRFAELQVVPNARRAEDLHRLRPDVGILAPVATPVFCRGVSSTGLRTMERLLEPYNLVPMQAGGAAPPEGIEANFEPGAAIAVPITTGDIEMTAIGTLTWLDDGVALGFGHPFFGFGKVEMPMGTGYIHQVIGTAASSFKLGSLLKPVGAITQDRPTCIGGQLGRRADTLPVHYALNEMGRGARDFKIRMIRQEGMTNLYTALLMQMAMQNVAGSAFDGVTRSTVTIRTRVEDQGQPMTIRRVNSFDSKAATEGSGNPLWDLFMTLNLLSQNPFGEAEVDAVDVELQFDTSRRFANIERAQAAQQTVKPGEQLDVEVFLKPYGGQTTSLTVPVKVPANAPLGRLVVLLVGGSDAGAVRTQINAPPFPRDVPSLIRWLNDSVANDTVVVEAIRPTVGLEMSGHQMHDIPTPIAEPLFTSPVDDMRMIPDVDEQVIPTADVVAGIAAVVVEVIGHDGQHADEGGGDLSNIPIGPMLAPESPVTQEMQEAAARTMAGLVGGLRPTPELSWTMQPPVLGASAPARLRLERIIAALGGQRPAAPPRARRGPGLFGRGVAPTARRGAGQRAAGAVPRDTDDDAPAADDDDDGANDAETPDLTDSLQLDQAPRMPDWKELDKLGKGKLVTDEEAASDKESASDEEEDKALARPVSIWNLSTVEDFIAGRFDGSYPASDGAVRIAPLTTKLGKPDAERTWSVLALRDGTTLTGSWGPEATLYQLGADKQVSEYYKTDEAGLFALAQMADGSVVAGGIPSGKIYQITAAGQGKVLVDLDEEYIWSLIPEADGGLYAATGRNGRLYHIDAAGQAKVVLESNDRHIISLAAAPGGGVYAATWPLGKLYKVTADGVESVFQSANGGALSLAATPNGNVYMGTADSGSIYKIEPSGMATQLTDVDDSHIYAMVNVGDTVYAAASGPGQLVRLSDTDDKALVYRTDEPYLLGLAAADGERLLSSIAGSGEVVQLELGTAQRGEYLSPIHDAEMRAQWGVARWEAVTDGEARVAIQTRTGNTAVPDRAWSPWSPWLTQSGGEAITSPPARYIQFRALFYAAPGETCRLDSIDLFFRTINRPPKVTLESPAAGTVARQDYEISWEGEDPDEDDLHYQVFYAPVGSEDWTFIAAKDDSSDDDDEAGEGDDTPAADDADETDDEAAPAAKDEGNAADDETGPTAFFTPFRRQPRPASLLGRFAEALPLQGGEALPGTKGYRGDGSAPGTAPKAENDEKDRPDDAGDDKPEKLTESSITWDTTTVPDGLYRIKVVAFDDIRNPDDPKTATVISRPLRIDNTGPVLRQPESLEGRPPATLVVADDGTWLASAEFRLDDDEWKAILPADGLFDSPEETLKTPDLPTEGGEHTLTVRVRDSVGNLSTFQWTFTNED